MRQRNYYVYNEDTDVLKTLKEEYEGMGREARIEGNRLTVFALSQVKPKKEKEERKPRREE